MTEQELTGGRPHWHCENCHSIFVDPTRIGQIPYCPNCESYMVEKVKPYVPPGKEDMVDKRQWCCQLCHSVFKNPLSLGPLLICPQCKSGCISKVEVLPLEAFEKVVRGEKDMETPMAVIYCDLCGGVVYPEKGRFCQVCMPVIEALTSILSVVSNRVTLRSCKECVKLTVTFTKEKQMPKPQNKVKKDVVKIASDLATAAMSAKIYETMKPIDIANFCLDVAKQIAIADDIDEDDEE